MLSLAEEELALTSVTQYAWSADSSVLAVAFETDQGRYLGGADVANVEHAPGSGAAVHFPLLDATAAAVDSPLVWYAGTQLAFFTLDPDPIRWPNTTALTASGFDEPTLGDEQYGVSQLIGGVGGFFVIPSSLDFFAFYPSDGSLPIGHDPTPRTLRAISPSGHYLGRANGDVFELFHATSATAVPQDPPADTTAGCSAILAWAEDRERIACASGAEVKVFDVDTTVDQLTEPELIIGSYDYPIGAHTQRQRRFSKSGDRFVFTTKDFVYVAVLNDGSPRIEGDPVYVGLPLPQGENVFTELAFSPDELLLAFHRGSRLQVDALDDGLAPILVSGEMPASKRCEEDFTGAAGTYCGGVSAPLAFRWSGDSDWIAYRNASGELRARDLRNRQNEDYDGVPVTEPCAGDNCQATSVFEFQPSIGITSTR
jgi:hypothetical protein